MYTSKQAAETAIRELGVGWTIFPYSEPERGVYGYCAVRDSKEKVFQWTLFGRELEPDVKLLKPTDLVGFIQSEPQEHLHASDDPKKRHYGFVSYRLASEGKAIVRRATLTQVKDLPSHPRAVLMETHDRLTRKDRAAETKVLKPYGWLRVWLMRIVRTVLPLR